MATGALHNVNRSVLKMTANQNTAQTGAAYQVLPAQADEVQSPAQGWRVYFRNEQSGGATSPTSQVKLQTSYDKVSWFDVAQSTQLTADGSKAELADITALGPFVRAITLVGGSTAPNHKAEVRLVSNAGFTLKAV